MTMPDIQFDKQKTIALRAAYTQPVLDGAEKFIFEEKEYVTTYVKLMLQYLESKYYIANYKLN